MGDEYRGRVFVWAADASFALLVDIDDTGQDDWLGVVDPGGGFPPPQVPDRLVTVEIADPFDGRQGQNAPAHFVVSNEPRLLYGNGRFKRTRPDS